MGNRQKTKPAPRHTPASSTNRLSLHSIAYSGRGK
jgi:hypothetical protein